MKIAFASILGDDSVFDIGGDGFVTHEGTPIGWLRGNELEIFVEPQPEPKESEAVMASEAAEVSAAALEAVELALPWEHAQHRELLLRQVRAAMHPRETVVEDLKPAAPGPLDRLKMLEDKLVAVHARLDRLEK